jgi:hypothetical protein
MPDASCDVVLIGAGIMSASLATLLGKLDPSLRIVCFERLDRAVAESSDAWNNAGTGHAGYRELNYNAGRRRRHRKAVTIADGDVTIVYRVPGHQRRYPNRNQPHQKCRLCLRHQHAAAPDQMYQTPQKRDRLYHQVRAAVRPRRLSIECSMPRVHCVVDDSTWC